MCIHPFCLYMGGVERVKKCAWFCWQEVDTQSNASHSVREYDKSRLCTYVHVCPNVHNV